MSEQIFIKSFVSRKQGIIMNNAIAFSNGDSAVLYEKTGHILRLDARYLESIKQGCIPTEIINKLQKRNFIYDIDSLNNECECGVATFPEFFMIDLTNKCNMHCKYCLRDVNTSDLSVSERTLRDICNYIIMYCKKHNLRNITIQPWGGEPLIELDYILLMRNLLSIEETNVHFSIETNAVLLNEDIIDILYENRIGLGISIDGYGELHDSQRVLKNGKGTHKTVEKNLLLAKQKYGSRLGTITTLTRINAPYIENILEYYALVLGLTNVKFNYVHESMFSDCSYLCMSKEQIAETEIRLLKKLVELNERGYYIFEQNIKVKLYNLLFKRYSNICHSNGCSGGRKMIVFDMEGKIFPCELTDTPSENIGSIYDNVDLLDIVEKSIRNKDFFVTKKDVKCDECMWYVFCKGGCTVRAISIGKRPPKVDEIECAVNSTLYPELLQLILEKPQIVNRLVGENIL